MSSQYPPAGGGYGFYADPPNPLALSRQRIDYLLAIDAESFRNDGAWCWHGIWVRPEMSDEDATRMGITPTDSDRWEDARRREDQRSKYPGQTGQQVVNKPVNWSRYIKFFSAPPPVGFQPRGNFGGYYVPTSSAPNSSGVSQPTAALPPRGSSSSDPANNIRALGSISTGKSRMVPEVVSAATYGAPSGVSPANNSDTSSRIPAPAIQERSSYSTADLEFVLGLVAEGDTDIPGALSDLNLLDAGARTRRFLRKLGAGEIRSEMPELIIQFEESRKTNNASQHTSIPGPIVTGNQRREYSVTPNDAPNDTSQASPRKQDQPQEWAPGEDGKIPNLATNDHVQEQQGDLTRDAQRREAAERSRAERQAASSGENLMNDLSGR